MAKPINVLIIGSGPAGYTAAIYAARAGLEPVVLTGGDPGGQLTTTQDVENFPGYPEGINGPQMMIDLQKQAERFGTTIHYKSVTGVDFSSYPLTLTLDERETVKAKAVVIATGATARYLGLPSEKKFMNQGVSACAICDGYFYREKPVAVVGAGDSASEESIYLSKLCPEVHLIVRKDHMRASKIMQQRVLNTSNIIVHWNSETEEVLGDETGVTGVRIKDTITSKSKDIPIHGFFLAIGHTPNTAIFKEYLNMDETGYIKVKPGTTHTCVEGVFAVGDAVDRVYRQAITAAGTGCMGALDAEKFLAARRSTHGFIKRMKLDILVLASHPDDAELGCGGTIAKHTALGFKVGIVDFTRGELGTRGTTLSRKQEAEQAADILGLSVRENLDLPDGFFQCTEESVHKVIYAIRRYRPNIVLANAIRDRHPDHIRGAELAFEACFLAGLSKIETSREGTIQAPWRPKALYHYIQSMAIQPDIIVDISSYWDQKMKAIHAFRSQFYDPESADPETYISSKGFLKMVEARGVDLGHSIGVNYGEGFIARKTIGVNKLTDIY